VAHNAVNPIKAELRKQSGDIKAELREQSDD
jgi:hypothetical protein